MVEHRVLHDAALLRGDGKAAGKALDYSRTHRGDAQLRYLDALVGAGRLDDAAAHVATLLADPFERTPALAWMQDWRLTDALPGEVRYRASREALLERDDVQAAVARVGRIETQPIFALE